MDRKNRKEAQDPIRRRRHGRECRHLHHALGPCPDPVHLAEFTRANSLKPAKDIDGNLVYLADTRVNLSLAQERWPKVAFHDTREHGQVMG
jgi:peptide subunit release factor RF-3